MPLVLAGATSGSTTLQATDAVTQTITLPNNTGTIITTGSSGVITQSMLATAASSIGVGQTWQDVSGSRTAGVTYTNSTGKPIMVSVRTTATTTDFTITVDSVVTAQVTNINTTRMFMTTIVPNGSTYVVSGYQGGSWAELR